MKPKDGGPLFVCFVIEMLNPALILSRLVPEIKPKIYEGGRRASPPLPSPRVERHAIQRYFTGGTNDALLHNVTICIGSTAPSEIGAPMCLCEFLPSIHAIVSRLIRLPFRSPYKPSASRPIVR